MDFNFKNTMEMLFIKKFVPIFLILLQPSIQCQPAINQQKYSFFSKIRLLIREIGAGDSRKAMLARLEPSRGLRPMHFRPVSSISRSFHYLRGSPRDRSMRHNTSPTSCTRKPFKAARFCWPIIEARRYVKMSRRFLMKPRYLYIELSLLVVK